jgi:hemolysin activation/secretion protein
MTAHPPFRPPRLRAALLAGAALLAPGAAGAADPVQNPVDRADPSVVERQRDNEERHLQPPAAQLPAAPAPARGDAAMPEGPPLVAGAIRVDGATALPPSAFAAAIEPWLGRPLGPDALRALARDVADAARRAGFPLATAWIARQDLVAGVLHVTLDEGRIDAIEALGPGHEEVERRLAPLASGRPIRTAELERALLLAGDMPGVSLGRPRIVRRNGRNILVVQTGFDRVQGRATLDNAGSATAGPVRARLAVDINSILARGDRLSLGAMVMPLQPREFQLAEAAYRVPVGHGGTEVTASAYVGHSRAGGSLRDADLAGLSRQAEVSVSRPLLRTRAASVWAGAALTVRDSSLDRVGGRIRDDRIVTATATLYANGQLGGGRIRVRLSYAQGLDWLRATQRGDPLASRADGGGRFSAGRAWAQYDRGLGGGFSLQLAGEAQLASRPLLASEEIGLGGRQFLRAFDYWEVSGDEGAAASAELRYDFTGGLPRPLSRLQLYLYADAGRATNLRGGFGGGSLASAGGGARAWFDGGFEAGLELGLPLTDSPFDPDPDPRISVSLGSSF